MKRILLAVLFVTVSLAASAQGYKTDTARGFDPSRVMIGGALGLAFGDYTFVNISPMIGYRFTPMIAAGVNINAQYSSGKSYDMYNSVVSRNNYTMFGGGLWGRFYPIEQLFLHAQPEYNFISSKYKFYNPDETIKDNYGAPSLLLGGGYSMPVGGRSAITLMILYDVIQDDRTPYLNRPIFSGGVNIGL
ncbi:hypothetical protein ACWKWU_19695 [Chitinophaga lutea]